MPHRFVRDCLWNEDTFADGAGYFHTGSRTEEIQYACIIMIFRAESTLVPVTVAMALAASLNPLTIPKPIAGRMIIITGQY